MDTFTERGHPFVPSTVNDLRNSGSRKLSTVHHHGQYFVEDATTMDLMRCICAI